MEQRVFMGTRSVGQMPVLNGSPQIIPDLHRFETEEIGWSMDDRLLTAAGRLLADKTQLSGKPRAVGHVLRADQLPVFKDFAFFLTDFATHPHRTDRSNYCRIVLPPRTGKTVIAAHIIEKAGLTTTFVVPSKALVKQIGAELRVRMPVTPLGIFYGEEKNCVEHGINVTTYSSLQRHVGRDTLPAAIRSSALVFADEAHHAMTSLRQEAMDNAFHAKAIRVAMTATPNYDGHRRLSTSFPYLVHEIDLGEAFSLGLLAPVRVWVVEVDADASSVRLVAGDYQQETLGRLMSSAPFFRAVEVLRYQNGNARLPCMIACASRQQAHDLWKYLRQHRAKGSAEPALILGETARAERDQKLADFQSGRLDTLIQVGVLIEGWDAPRCKLLLDLAPSVSRVRATQKYFRVMTQYQEQEARIIVLVPTGLSRQPLLPLDILLSPGDLYTCGELLGTKPQRPATGRGTLDEYRGTPIEGVRIAKRVLVSATLQKPRLDPQKRDQIRELLLSHPKFDPTALPNRSTFERLIFEHPLFTGAGRGLLEWLGIGRRRDAYWAFWARLYPEEAANRLLIESSHDRETLEYSCYEDLHYLEEEMLRPSPDNGRPVEPFPSTLRALGGDIGEIPTPEDHAILVEEVMQTHIFLQQLTPREQEVLTLKYGLCGREPISYNQVGELQDVTGGRISQIAHKGLRRLKGRFAWLEKAPDRLRKVGPVGIAHSLSP